MKFYNSLTRVIDEFVPILDKEVRMYTCGPTVYQTASIGNFRTYTISDILYRVLSFNGYKVRHIMNITDVGHLTGDNLGDSSTGDDRLELASKKEGKNSHDIAQYYTDVFISDYNKLGLTAPERWVKATDHINEQIKLVKTLEKKGFAYVIGGDGVYFDTSKFDSYGQLSVLDKIKEGARVTANPNKKNPQDFALWKFSKPEDKRQQEWNSPWGVGFPGWHIECSAMSMKYLGETFDIHVGGEDLRGTHHPNEIAQSEAATGKKFVNYWVHITFLLVDGQKMSKSLGNTYSVLDIEKNGINPLALKYLYLGAHYRSPLNFTLKSLKAADTALAKIKEFIIRNYEHIPLEQKKYSNEFIEKFLTAMNDDLDTPNAVAQIWGLLKSDLTVKEKLVSLAIFDEVLGLNFFSEAKNYSVSLAEEIKELIKKRDEARKNKKWAEADSIRNRIKSFGFDVEDTEQGAKIFPLK